MAQAEPEQPSIFPEGDEPQQPVPAQDLEDARAEIALLTTERKALEDRILKLSALAEDMDRAAQQFAGASLSMDVRSPSDSVTARDLALRAWQDEVCLTGDDAPEDAFAAGWRFALRQPIPDGPELPQDSETWTRMRRALKLGRSLARLAREVAEGIGELRKAAK